MKTKIVYCLVSDGQDYYYEQLLISLCSLRRHNPEADVEVVCDNDTNTTLTGTRHGIFDYDIHVHPVETPSDWKKWERSRYLKTHLRNLIQGDYLFIDTDTIICSSLDFIDDISSEIAAVLDSHVEHSLPSRSQCKHETELWIWRQAQKTGANIEGLWQYNSGVMLVRDTPQAHELYARWASHYQSQLQFGVKVDQLPLLLSNHEMNNVIASLDPRLNCQVSFQEGRSAVAEAAIIHYFPGQKKTLLSSPWILDPIKETGLITAPVQRIISQPAQFFSECSAVATGDAARLLFTPSLLEAYTSCPKVFSYFVKALNAYLFTKKWLYGLYYHPHL